MRTSNTAAPRRARLAVLALATLATGIGGVAVTANEAHGLGHLNQTWQQPYGGCEEGTIAPQSAAADECREHGWTLMRRLAVNPHGVVKGSGLPHCEQEDGSGRDTARCIWNGGRDGNGYGLSYWIDVHDRTHYVWMSGISKFSRDHGMRWVDRELGDALAEGGSPHADTRDWRKCAVHVGPTTTVWCPDKIRPVEVS